VRSSHLRATLLLLALLALAPAGAFAAGYVIVTTSAIRADSEMLVTFAAAKTARGFEVTIYDETDWGGAGLTNNAAAEALRGFLQSAYALNDFDYLLLIGDPRHWSGPIPMKRLYPRTTGAIGHGPPGYDPTCAFSQDMVPSDYYYAELDGDWDLDGDNLYGEFGEAFAAVGTSGDFGPGGIERDHEYAVGRIPVYGGTHYTQDVIDLDHILAKTIAYQHADPDSVAWRNSALVAAEGANRIFFGEAIRNDVLLPAGFSQVSRVYDADVCLADVPPSCDPTLTSTPEATTCTVPNVAAEWDATTPGLVTWFTHGGGWGAVSVMTAGEAPNRDDDHPVITFQASCLNSQPTTNNNVSYALLKNGAIATVGATEESHGPGSPVDLTSASHESGISGMAYHFMRRVGVDGQTVGDALMEIRRDQTLYGRCWYWQNFVGFNLYGDPEVSLYDTADVSVPSLGPAGLAALCLGLGLLGCAGAARSRRRDVA